ncbi:hypothetical protein [Pleomorphomonas carboxyditropha]|uniref:Uncharacterized protein n=1 Tax=Pleomorphomonas carboxyditropha TaxID=2023338 RepID=A0A2G9WRP4_9HYPH|nr:hypothetical protein [Pleomorphomonas carboxyditropha]PIO96810.1 hypothetical protein CJ014_23440 [Pleomorphomonas carboxyditropha]
MKTLALAVVAVTAIALPSLASAAEQTYWDPADSAFVTGSMQAPATANNDSARYTETVTYWDPADSAFVTTKVAATPVIATHDAVKTGTTTIRMWEPADSAFVEVPVGN